MGYITPGRKSAKTAKKAKNLNITFFPMCRFFVTTQINSEGAYEATQVNRSAGFNLATELPT